MPHKHIPIRCRVNNRQVNFWDFWPTSDMSQQLESYNIEDHPFSVPSPLKHEMQAFYVNIGNYTSTVDVNMSNML